MLPTSWQNPYIARLAELPGYIIGSADKHLSPTERTELLQVFQRFSRRVVELGSGSGGHLVQRAVADPTCLHLGIELRFKRVVRTAQKALAAGIQNLVVVRGSAQEVLPVIPEASLEAIYINFPDPWDKQRWRKHRLLSESFLQSYLKLLLPNGILSYKTDHEEYFKVTLETIQASSGFKLKQVTHDLYASELVKYNVPSEFEKLFTSKALPIYFLEAGKLLSAQ